MKTIRIGVMGVGRGQSMINYARTTQRAQLVAICDFWPQGLHNAQVTLKDPSITYYADFDSFIQHDMDAVILANYATEHAPYAIKALKAGKHVFSEVLPVQTLAEAVALIETIEATGLTYAYGENYCYMPAVMEMRRRYRNGDLGIFEYGEGEYIHNCEPIWADLTAGNPKHWRNRMYATFYATHSIGPLVHITGLRPVKVTGFEIPYNARSRSMGKLGATAGIEMITFENGAMMKSIHGDLDQNSIWFSLYGSKGRMESAREDTLSGDVERVYVHLEEKEPETYQPVFDDHDLAHTFGHGGSDFYTMDQFIRHLHGEPAELIDIYEALDMFLPGLFAYRSILNHNQPIDIPNFRDPQVRERYRFDNACTDPKVAGDQLLPCQASGDPDIDPSIYSTLKARWEAHHADE
jgi:predicted dehydrogenase